MSNGLHRLVVRIDSRTEQIQDWLGFDENGVFVSHGHQTALPAVEILDLAIPAACLTAHCLTLPTVNKKQRELLISQALEDRVLGKLSDLHWLAGQAVDGKTTVWVIEKNRLATISKWGAQSGLSFQRWLPECLLLPHALTYAHSGAGLIFCTETEAGWLEDEAELLALYPHQSFKEIAISQMTAPAADAVSFYRNEKVSLTSNWNDWRVAVYILIAAVFIYLLSLLIQWRSLAHQESALRQEIRQTFASIFPGVPIVDPILQWQSQQKAADHTGTTGDALDLLHKTAAQIDLELGIDSVEVKAGKVSIVVPESKSGALVAKLTAQGANVQSIKMPDGRMNVEVKP